MNPKAWTGTEGVIEHMVLSVRSKSQIYAPSIHHEGPAVPVQPSLWYRLTSDQTNMLMYQLTLQSPPCTGTLVDPVHSGFPDFLALHSLTLTSVSPLVVATNA